jgi:hypothetical protein
MAAQQASEETSPPYDLLASLLRKEDGIVIARARYPQLNVDGEDPMCFFQSYFVIACNNGDFRVARALLEMGVDVTVRDGFGQTPLILACFGNNKSDEESRLKMVAWLLQCVAGVRTSIDEGGYRGDTALHVTAAEGRVEIVRLLLRFGANCTKRNMEGFTAAELAQARRKEKAAVLLGTFAQISEIGEWRPWKASEFPLEFRRALRCLVVISKSGTNLLE